MTLSPESKRRRYDFRLDDLPHMVELPAFVFCELLTLKEKIMRCERMIDRHGAFTRLGSPWFRKARRLDKLYCQLWRRFPAPLVFSDPIPLPDGAVTDHPSGCTVVNVSLTMTTELCPISGFRHRLRFKLSKESRRDLREGAGKDMETWLREDLSKVGEIEAKFEHHYDGPCADPSLSECSAKQMAEVWDKRDEIAAKILGTKGPSISAGCLYAGPDGQIHELKD